MKENWEDKFFELKQRINGIRKSNLAAIGSCAVDMQGFRTTPQYKERLIEHNLLERIGTLIEQIEGS